MISTDGENWSLHQAPGDNQWRNIVFVNGRFIALATLGDAYRVMWSTDGVNWERSNAVPLQVNWDALAYGNGRYVAVSVGGHAMHSTDLMTWTISSQAPSSSWHSVTYGNGRFVAIAYGGTNRVMTSTDGVNWTGISVAANTWRSVTYANGTFVAVANGGTNRVMTSSDGITWYPQSVPEEEWMFVTYANGQFIAVATAGGADRVMTSLNRIDWTTQTAPPRSNGNPWPMGMRNTWLLLQAEISGSCCWIVLEIVTTSVSKSEVMSLSSATQERSSCRDPRVRQAPARRDGDRGRVKGQSRGPGAGSSSPGSMAAARSKSRATIASLNSRSSAETPWSVSFQNSSATLSLSSPSGR